MQFLMLVAIVVAVLYACDQPIPFVGAKYAAEVGYHRGTEQQWDVWGDFDSLDDCRDAAVSRFNALNRDSASRAISWSCLKKNRSGGYESRHR
jgi:hypothetical protein